MSRPSTCRSEWRGVSTWVAAVIVLAISSTAYGQTFRDARVAASPAT
jgi:hypothetical protein